MPDKRGPHPRNGHPGHRNLIDGGEPQQPIDVTSSGVVYGHDARRARVMTVAEEVLGVLGQAAPKLESGKGLLLRLTIFHELVCNFSIFSSSKSNKETSFSTRPSRT
jgi:hypothetical protein